MAYQVKIVDEASGNIAEVGSDKKLKVSAEITGSTTSTAPGEDVPAASEVIAGQSPTGKVRNVLVTEEGKLQLDVGEVTATIGEIEGKAAEGAAVSGKPVLIGGRYDSTPRSIDDGDVGAVAVNDKGQVQVEVTGSLPSLSAGSATIGYVGSTGSNERLYVTNHDKTASIAAAGTENVIVTASPGHLALLEHLGIYIPAPSGASSGTHKIIVGLGSTTTAVQILDVTAAFGAAIQIVNGAVVGTATILPTTDVSALLQLLKGHTFSEVSAEGIHIQYLNNTDVAQAGTRQYRLNYVEWPIA